MNPFKTCGKWLRSRLPWATKNDLNLLRSTIMATQAEHAAEIRLLTGQVTKIGGEINATQAAMDLLQTRVAELEALLAAGGEVSAEVLEAFASLKAQVQATDDEIPDPITPVEG